MNEDKEPTRVYGQKCPSHDGLEKKIDVLAEEIRKLTAEVAKHSGSLQLGDFRMNLHDKLLFGCVGSILTAFMGGVIYLVFNHGKIG